MLRHSTCSLWSPSILHTEAAHFESYPVASLAPVLDRVSKVANTSAPRRLTRHSQIFDAVVLSNKRLNSQMSSLPHNHASHGSYRRFVVVENAAEGCSAKLSRSVGGGYTLLD